MEQGQNVSGVHAVIIADDNHPFNGRLSSKKRLAPVLVEHDGPLVDYFADEHPHR